MNPIVVRNLKIGEGIPKICLPIVGHTQYEITSQAMTIAALRPDIVEFRADWYDECVSDEHLMEMLKLIRKLVDMTPLLFTFRTSNEGGIQEIEKDEYLRINKVAIESGLVDMIDIELMIGDKEIKDLVNLAHKNDVIVLMSNHDFEKTPEKDVLVERMEKMIKLGADIPKIAVMPQNKADVLTLLSATNTMYEEFADRPIITMSMAGTGAISRVCGEVFGSALTFGAAKKASAPGQVAVADLKTMLELLHKSL